MEDRLKQHFEDHANDSMDRIEILYKVWRGKNEVRVCSFSDFIQFEALMLMKDKMRDFLQTLDVIASGVTVTADTLGELAEGFEHTKE
jgi:hypothetical protein